MPKSDHQAEHARGRLLERYGITAGRDRLEDIARLIRSPKDQRSGRALFLEERSRRIAVWAIWIDGQWVPTVYDRRRGTVVTFLPREELERFQPILAAINGK